MFQLSVAAKTPLVVSAWSLGAVLLSSTVSAQAPGLRLFQAVGPNLTQMVDNQGTIVHSWPGSGNLIAHVGPDGSLWRGAQTGSVSVGGATGRLQRLAFDGTMLWDFTLDGPARIAHHDIEPMPNGNVLVIAWDGDTAASAVAAGRDPATLAIDWWPDSILEIQPTGLTTGTIVWEWHFADHLIQDFDPSKANYGIVANHPELLDVNFPPTVLSDGDWNHVNGLDYDPINDWIVLSAREQNEIYIIDHSTTTAEAAGHTGGARGKGGDFLYRWGNSQSYTASATAPQQLFGQHDPRFIPPGYPGAGNLTLFNNDYITNTQSAVFELVLPLDVSGNFILDPLTGRFGPATPHWAFTEPGFLSLFVSSAERLPNGNTLICSGTQNRMFEVTPSGQTIWSHSITNSVLIFQCNYVDRALWHDNTTLSVGGGQVNFDHVVGSSNAGQLYLLLGSVSGTTPGTHVPGGVTLPLNADYLTTATATQFNSGVFSHTIGTLDPNGSGSSALIVPAGFIPPVLAGLQMDFAHMIWNSSLLASSASNPVRVTIVP